MATKKTAPGAVNGARPACCARDAARPGRTRLLWLGIDNVSFDEALDAIVALCRRAEPAYVVTPNVDHFMRVRRDDALRGVYERADLVLADGMPLLWAARLLGRPLKEKVSGSDLFGALCERAARDGLRVFLLGGAPGIAEKAARAMCERYPGLTIAGTCSPTLNESGISPDDGKTIRIINDARPHVVFVAFGCPKQEWWMVRNYKLLGGAVCIGVGASFDFAAGVQRRAPRWMQRAGLEWFWRLLHEPGRLWKRYLVDDLPFFRHVVREWIGPAHPPVDPARLRIGYLLSRFPAQTSAFHWREKRALNDLGVETDVISTQAPAPRLMPHGWSAEAMGETTYLFPLRLRAALGATVELLRAGPAGWWRCLRAVAGAEGRRSRLCALIPMGAQLSWLARRGGWRHVHVHSCAQSAAIAMFARLLSGISYSLTLHGPLVDYGPDQRLKWRHAAFAIVITRRLLGQAREMLGDDLPPVVDVAPMGVEVAAFTRSTPYTPWAGEGPAVVFSCGRLHPCKGHDQLVRAVAEVRQRGVDARLRIAGEDVSAGAVFRAGLEALIDELSLAQYVTLLGAVPEDQVRAELEHAHIFALASLHEPLGVAIMEAMSMEVPVVVTGAGGVPELVDDGADGMLVEAESPAGMASAMLAVLRDPVRARQMGEAGRRKVAAGFHSGVSAAAILRCLKKIEPATAEERAVEACT